jgi:hypothetical protein
MKILRHKLNISVKTLRTSCMSKQMPSKSINLALIDTHLNQDAEKSRNQRVANFKDIKVKESIKEICKVSLAL